MKTILTVQDSARAYFDSVAEKHNMKTSVISHAAGASRVAIDGDHLTMSECTAFYVDWERVKVAHETAQQSVQGAVRAKSSPVQQVEARNTDAERR